MSAAMERVVNPSQDRGALARMVMQLLVHWDQSTEALS
jgi:hypothetical protein